MSWWCSASKLTWSWTPRPYIGAWLVIAALFGAYARLWRRWRPEARTPEESRDDRRRAGTFIAGVVVLWATFDWPLAALGAGYLASAQAVRQVLLVLVAAPLLSYGVPSWMAERLLAGRRLRVAKVLARPVVALLIADAIFVAGATPWAVDGLFTSQAGAFVLDGAWMFGALVLWLPVQSSHPQIRTLSPPATMVYLIAQSIAMIVPAFFMTWASFPLFAIYELAPRVVQISPVDDQQLAAAILQVAGALILWGQIGMRFVLWGVRQQAADRADLRLVPADVRA